MRLGLEIPEDLLEEMLGEVPLPRMCPVKYAMSSPPAIEDVEGRLHDLLADSESLSSIQPGQRVAIAVGSRGISGLKEMVRGLVRELNGRGARPFVVPAMGSHGGATAEGQTEVLRQLGITEESIGAAITSGMETEVVGKTAGGLPVHVDRNALLADAIVLVVRIKAHTAFRGRYESGLAKMIAIGLGKQHGAAAAHAAGFGRMAEAVPDIAEVALANAPIRFAVASVENAHERPFKLVVLPAARFLLEEPSLLQEAKESAPHLPFQQLDVLIIDRIGKNISGDGADPNITGRYPTPYASGGPEISKQIVLDLTNETGGNANGIGTADFTTVRAARKMVLAQTYPNALTSTVPGPVKLPMILPSDRLAVAAGILTCNPRGTEPTVVRIKDTLHLDHFWVSVSLGEHVQRSPQLSFLGPPLPFNFDATGSLTDLSEEEMPKRHYTFSDQDVW